MKYSMSIAMVAILMAAAFAGVFVMADDADAVVFDPVSIDIEDKIGEKSVSNTILGNTVAYADGKITGSVTKVTDETKFIQTWYYGGEEVAENDTTSFSHFIIFSIKAGTGMYVSFVASDNTLKSVEADENGNVVIVAGIDDKNCKQTFTYAITEFEVKNSMTGLQTSSFEIDVQMDVVTLEIWYNVDGKNQVLEVKSGVEYALVSIDDLGVQAPAGKKFVGWSDGKTVYSIGSKIQLNGDVPEKKYKFTAVFEDLPAASITFIDGTSTLKTINVADLSINTIPTMSKPGYTFDGWFMGTEKVDPLKYAFTESVTLVAQWTPVNCAVTFVAGDFVKTVPVLYGDRVQELALPAGYDRWDFDFSTIITEDVTITAVEKAPAEPTGLKDPTNQITLMIVGLFAFIIVICLIIKRDEVRAYGVKLLTKKDNMEDKKE